MRQYCEGASSSAVRWVELIGFWCQFQSLHVKLYSWQMFVSESEL